MKQRLGLALAAWLILAFPLGAQPQGRSRIGHVVVIYLENWSFDGLYGNFPGAEGLREAGDGWRQTDRGGKPLAFLAQPKDPAGLPDHRFPDRMPAQPYDLARYLKPGDKTGDLVHRFYQHQAQIDGGLNDRFAAESDNPGLVLSRFDASKLPLGKLAAKYTLCDHYFAGAFGGSFLNHIYLISAQVPRWPKAPLGLRARLDHQGRLLKDGAVTPDGDVVNTVYSTNQPHPANTDPGNLLPPLTFDTIGERLIEAGVDWAWYSGGWDAAVAGRPDPDFQFHHQPFAYFKPYGDGTRARAVHLRDESRFLRDLDSGDLPTVAFVKPLGRDNEHPGYAALADGERHVAEMVGRIQASPVWKDCVIFITYDEFGGRWDHVAPPKRDAYGPGTRVPLLVVSPFAKRAFVDKTPYETASLLRFLEEWKGLRPLTERDAKAQAPWADLDMDRP